MNNNLLWRLWSSPLMQATAGPVSLGLLLFLFMVDLLVPLGYAFALLNTLAILVAFFSREALWIRLATLLSVLSALLVPLITTAPPGIPASLVIFNRSVSIAVCLLAGFAALQILSLVSQVREANAGLRQSGELLEIASRIGKLGGWYVDLVAQKVSWSDEVARIHGHPPGYAPSFEEGFRHYPQEFRQLLLREFNLCATEGRNFDLDLQIVTVDGQRRWVRAVGQAVRNASQQIVGIHGAFQDIQAEMNSRLEVIRSAERWHALAEAMPLIVWTADAAGEVDFFSTQLVQYLKTPLHELTGAGWLRHLHPDDVPQVASRWQQHLQSHEPYEAEFRIRRHDGVHEWHLARAIFMQASNQRGIWYGSAMNIDALKRLQEQTTHLAERLTATMESVTDAILTVDRQWCFSFLNHHAETLLQRKREDLLGKVIWDVFPEAADSVFEQQYLRCMNERKTVRFEAFFAPLDMLFEINAYPSDDGMSVYFRNITEQRRLSDHMQQMQKLEALGQLTGGVAHDFNNLLTVIMGNSELLQEQLGAQPELEHLADMITGAAQRAAEMTQRLLAFARKQALEPVAADLNRLVAGIEPLLRRTLGADIDIEIINAGRLWTTLVDAGQLENCLLNLAINARDAMPDGGKLTIETANVHLDEAYTSQHLDLSPGQYVLLAVTDTGEGIPPDIIKKVFDPFFTTKESGKGTGLGLAMVYGFVKQSNGHITIYSEVGSGTTIKIYLPRLRQPDTGITPKAASPQRQQGAGELILLVEDDALVQQYTHNLLLELGYRVLTASNAAEALLQLKAHEDIDLLFTDIVMPGGMNGDKLAQEARKLRPELPVLYTSGYAENAIVHHGRLDPGVLLLGKPYRRSDLSAKLKQALATRA